MKIRIRKMNIRSSLFSIGLAMAVVTVSGCASQPKLTHEQILTQYQEVGQLESAVQNARIKDAELLAPKGFVAASTSLERAMKAARNNKSEVAKTEANEGLQIMEKLNRDVVSSREILAEVMNTRERAYVAGAKTLQGDKITALDEDLKETAALVEKGNAEQAKQRRPKLIADYAQLELVALKQGTVEQAKSAIANAKQQGAEKHASKTFAQAQEEMALAVSILDADRTQIDKADLHAKKTKWLAEQSAAISETVKDFDRRDYTMEDVVLWHQEQLGTVNQPLGGQLPFNEPSDSAVLSLKGAVINVMEERNLARHQLQDVERKSQVQLKDAEHKINSLMSANQEELQNLRAQHEQQLAKTEKEQMALAQKELIAQQNADRQIAALKSANQEELGKLRTQQEKQLASTEKERLAFEKKDQAEQQQFETVQAMFSGNEANVYRQRKNILISAHGFQFLSGQSEIEAKNFPMMNKIIKAIKTFPNARIEVAGHSDSMGNDQSNQKLSQSRAEKVAKFLKEVGGVAPDHIMSRGFGESKPVSSNETPEGRAENRRIEIQIVND